MGSSFAQLVFYTYPIVVFILFANLPQRTALIVTVILGFLVLPNGIGFDFPLVPAIGKGQLPILVAALALAIGLGADRRAALHRRGPAKTVEDMSRTRLGGVLLLRGLIAMAILSPFLSVLTNSDPVFAGPLMLPGLRLYDAFSMIGGALIGLLPFLLAQRYLHSPESHALLLRIFVIAMLLYTLPTLWEVRMSPQLHRQFYGFFPHSFAQHFRQGGWRPVVFMSHGLVLGILLCMAVLAAIGLWRQKRGLWLLAAAWLFLVLVLSKNFGALTIAIALAPVALLMRPSGQILLAAILAGIVLLYPMLRGADLVPVDRALTLAERIDPARAETLQFRIRNEDRLLARANLKPLSGWGGWGRNRVYNELGHDISVTDGAWVITIGVSGWIGYVAQFGLMCLPLILLALRRRKLQLSAATGGLALVLAANLFDLIPNASVTPVTGLIAGAIAGYYARARAPSTPRTKVEPEAEAEGSDGDTPAGAGPAGSRYTRYPPRQRLA